MDLEDRDIHNAPGPDFICGSEYFCSSEDYRWNRGSQEFPDICWKDASEVILRRDSDLFYLPIQNSARVAGRTGHCLQEFSILFFECHRSLSCEFPRNIGLVASQRKVRQ